MENGTERESGEQVQDRWSTKKKRENRLDASYFCGSLLLFCVWFFHQNRKPNMQNTRNVMSRTTRVSSLCSHPTHFHASRNNCDVERFCGAPKCNETPFWESLDQDSQFVFELYRGLGLLDLLNTYLSIFELIFLSHSCFPREGSFLFL